ncbi:hypothetical protein Acr_12g0004040 [Actinidia rufa]|uniref:Uncharacterized protein n=1 Tax=Actinidia rufa TaxID=165716 RepID=A0A7J0FH01_9ERIC|nr:hypothetical protein Acr_12g0004040 [Actinidia rufa]
MDVLKQSQCKTSSLSLYKLDLSPGPPSNPPPHATSPPPSASPSSPVGLAVDPPLPATLAPPISSTNGHNAADLSVI